MSLLVVGLAMLIGVPLGAIAGYRRGRMDAVIMRIVDLFLAFPPLLLAMAIVAALGPGLEHAALALTISWWPWYARLARGTATSLRERPFVEAARSIGVSDAHDPPPPHRAQLDDADPRPGDDRHRDRHPRGRLARVPRPRRDARRPPTGA